MSGERLVSLIREQRVTAEDVRTAISATVQEVDGSTIWVTSAYLDGGMTRHGPFPIQGTVNVGDEIFMERDQEDMWWVLGGVTPPGVAALGSIDGGRPDSVYGGTVLIDGGGV